MTDTRNTFLDKTFRKPNGKLAIMQIPNIPLSIWIVATILELFIKHGTPHTVIHWIGMVSLTVWAILEIVKGVNYFRRALGVIVLLGLLLSYARMLHG